MPSRVHHGLPVLTLVRRTLGRVALLFGAVVFLLILFQAAIVASAVTLQESHGFDKIAGLLPAFVQQGFGPALTSFGGMSAIGFFEPLIVILVVEFAIYLATEPAGDVEARIVDLLLARPLPRHQLITRSLIVMTGASIVLPLAMGASMWASLSILAPAGAVWPARHVVLLLMSHLAAVAWCFGGMALAAAAWSERRGSAQSIVGVSAVAFYLMEVVGEAWSRARWASRFSPFHHFHGADIMAGLSHPVRDLAILMAIGVVGVVMAYWQFQRRDV